MQRNGYKLPRDVAAFLSRLHDAPAFHFSDTQIEVERALELIEAAYMDGCRQGYIEGFVVRREVDRQRSRAGNAAKMKAPVRVGDRTVTRAERNEAMAKEFAELSQLMKPTPAMQRLADKYGFESWQGVAAAIKRFAKQTGQ